jgi:hypothetical protein
MECQRLCRSGDRARESANDALRVEEPDRQPTLDVDPLGIDRDDYPLRDEVVEAEAIRSVETDRDRVRAHDHEALRERRAAVLPMVTIASRVGESH